MSHQRENSLYRTRLGKEKASLRAKRAAEEQNQYRHVSFYAFDCKGGSLRWKHEINDFQPEEHSFKLLGKSENTKTEASQMIDLGEVDWRVYRRALLSQLPHSWQRREDTTLALAHFDRKKDKITKGGGLKAVPTAHIPGISDWNLAHVNGAESIKDPNVIVAHLREGIEVIHLYTGKRLTQLTLGMGTWDDINGDGVIDHAQANTERKHSFSLTS